MLKKIFPACILAAFALTGCSKSDIDPVSGGMDVPQGYVKLNINPVVAIGGEYLSKADPALLNKIDDVHVLIFEDSDQNGGTAGDGIIEDTDPLTIREFYEYGISQNIYLRKETVYYIYVVANLDDSNCPNGSVETFFDGVETYGDLKNLYVQSDRSPAEVGKILMATPEYVTVTFDQQDEVFTTVSLERMQSQFIVNVYNKVTSQTDWTVTSGVYPTVLNTIDIPRYSYVVEREVVSDGTHDYPFSLANKDNGYRESSSNTLPDPEVAIQFEGDWYTKQTIEFFSFENRRGSIPEINDYTNDTIGFTVPEVYGRRELAPYYSTYVQISSLTEGNALLMYIHAGKGRENPDYNVQPGDRADEDDITNFDVDRGCIYNFNVYIKSVTDVMIDTRREYLDQILIIQMPDAISRLDAHFSDVPAFVYGRKGGISKFQSGLCTFNPDGTIDYDTFTPMDDNAADTEKWLSFSWNDPYNPSTATTGLYIGIVGAATLDAVSGATPKLHFHEYIEDAEKAVIPAVDPPKRTAVIRVGFVAATGVDNNISNDQKMALYEQGLAESRESAFFVPVSQYGLKTIGQIGSFDGVRYMQLGVESVEEYTLRFYTEGSNLDVPNKGPYWQYRAGVGLTGFNQPHDGLTATKNHYDYFREQFANDIPPVRWQPLTVSPGGIYNPFTNANAADYCVRKNRDTDGDGFISGDEIKWYLPTPVQMMQIYTWRNAFKGGEYTLNGDSYVPFGSGSATSDTRYYWTTNEEVTAGSANAYVVDFYQAAANTTLMAKTARYPVRCVRDIETDADESMFYISANGDLVADLRGYFPSGMLYDDKVDASDNPISSNSLRNNPYNTLAQSFIISRWYVTGNNNHTGNPSVQQGDDAVTSCNSYREDNYTSGWRAPSQQELSFIQARTAMIEIVLATKYPDGPNLSTTYHTFRTSGYANHNHWAVTNVGNNSTFWMVNFATGDAQTRAKNSSAYTGLARCVRYTNNPPARP